MKNCHDEVATSIFEPDIICKHYKGLTNHLFVKWPPPM